MSKTELERAEKRYAQAKARLQALKNREATRQRKLDTRRKVILGGALLDLAERDSGAATMLDRLIRNLSREQDRKAFTDWQAPSPPAEANQSETSKPTASVEPGQCNDAPETPAGLSGSAVAHQRKDDLT